MRTVHDEMALLVIGPMLLDEIHFIPRGTTVRVAGGNATIFSALASLSGLKVFVMGSLGEDENGRIIRDTLVNSGVDISLVYTVENPTKLSKIRISGEGEWRISSECRAWFPYIHDRHLLVDTSRFEHVHVAGVNSLLRATPNLLKTFIQKVRRVGTTISFSLSRFSGGQRSAIDALVDSSSLMFCNKNEFCSLFDVGNTESLEAIMESCGFEKCLVTLGAGGVMLKWPPHKTIIHIGAPTVKAVNTVGAGDALSAILIAEIYHGESVDNAARTAVRAASGLIQCPSWIDWLTSGALTEWPRKRPKGVANG